MATTSAEAEILSAKGKFLSNAHLEMLGLRMVCSDNKKIRAKAMALFRPDYFYNVDAKKAITRVRAMAQKTGQQMSWRELTNDSVLPKDFRDRLKTYISENSDESSVVNLKLKKRLREAAELGPEAEQNLKTLKSGDGIDQVNTVEMVAKLLNDYQRTRFIWEFIRRTVKSKAGGEFNIDETYLDMQATAAHARVDFDENEVFSHVGEGDNADDVFDLVMDVRDTYLPTGWRDWDNKNGGVPRGSLWLLGANTGGGKSALSLQAAMNMALAGARVCFVPLEMDKGGMYQREFANLSGVDLDRILAGREKLTEKEQRLIKKKWTEFRERMKKIDGKMSFFFPPESMSMDEILYYLKPYEYDAIYIDYVGLLKGVDGDDQWRQLGSACRIAKLFALHTKSVVAVCAQLNDEGMIRYSKAMLEHANLAWFWSYDSKKIAEMEEDGSLTYEDLLVNVQQPKTRNQKVLNLRLYFDLAHMRVENMNETRMSEVGGSKNTKGKRADADDVVDATGDIDEEFELLQGGDGEKEKRRKKQKQALRDEEDDKESNSNDRFKVAFKAYLVEGGYLKGIASAERRKRIIKKHKPVFKEQYTKELKGKRRRA